MPVFLTANHFRDLVSKHYGFLSENYGYSIEQKADFAYEADSSNARIRIFMEHRTLVTDMEPIGESANQLLRINLVPKRIGIIVVCEYLDPRLNYEIAMLDRRNLSHNVPVELERRAALLRRYCAKLLEGDFSAWPGLMAYLSEKHKRK